MPKALGRSIAIQEVRLCQKHHWRISTSMREDWRSWSVPDGPLWSIRFNVARLNSIWEWLSLPVYVSCGAELLCAPTRDISLIEIQASTVKVHIGHSSLPALLMHVSDLAENASIFGKWIHKSRSRTGHHSSFVAQPSHRTLIQPTCDYSIGATAPPKRQNCRQQICNQKVQPRIFMTKIYLNNSSGFWWKIMS